MQKNPTKKQVRKGKSALSKLLLGLKDYNISVNNLLELTQPAWQGNKIDFANVYKHAINLKVNSFNIISVKPLMQSPYKTTDQGK